VTPNRHVNLAKRGVPKEYHVDYDDDQAADLFDELVDEVENIGVTS
jgi:hypothetical protein